LLALSLALLLLPAARGCVLLVLPFLWFGILAAIIVLLLLFSFRHFFLLAASWRLCHASLIREHGAQEHSKNKAKHNALRCANAPSCDAPADCTHRSACRHSGLAGSGSGSHGASSFVGLSVSFVFFVSGLHNRKFLFSKDLELAFFLCLRP
jgi:hypothetical protein